jgi:hypothetical protein
MRVKDKSIDGAASSRGFASRWTAPAASQCDPIAPVDSLLRDNQGL